MPPNVVSDESERLGQQNALDHAHVLQIDHELAVILTSLIHASEAVPFLDSVFVKTDNLQKMRLIQARLHGVEEVLWGLAGDDVFHLQFFQVLLVKAHKVVFRAQLHHLKLEVDIVAAVLRRRRDHLDALLLFPDQTLQRVTPLHLGYARAAIDSLAVLFLVSRGALMMVVMRALVYQ